MPLTLAEIRRCELAIRFTPAGEIVGGDFYDVFAVRAPDRWALVVGDVCGKGAAAAATTAMVRWSLRSATQLTSDPVAALRHVNELMLRRGQRHLFATLAYLELTIRPREAHLIVACAGHPPPIIITPGEEPEPVEARSTLLGVYPDPELHVHEQSFTGGEIIVAYTDGALGWSDDPTAPIRRVLRAQNIQTADAAANAVEHYAKSHTRRPRDDIAIAAVRYLGNAVLTTRRGRTGQLART